MIKFFRQIRRDLMEKNNTGKYLKYAIGEIVLVMIGILLALQVNNWNEMNKKKRLKNEYQTSLTNDYTKDTLQLNDRLKRNKKRLALLTSVIDSIDNGFYTTIEDYIELYLNNFSSISVINIYNSNSFNLLISTGNIDLFDKKFRTELMELNRLQRAEQIVQNGNKDYLFKFMQNVSLKYPSPNIGNPFHADAAIQLLWKNVRIDDLPRDLLSLISQERYTIIRYIELTESVLHQTELVLKLLNNSNT
ncbi:DUF6090 family protein [Geojedonia litorea]|uniref:DUF6090 family protein n=1 Tax=Geojedonia litorea TaxID=1268269 RepID=A0ABV9N121_9FLAO